MSEDGRHAITLIAFVGSVFSPYYAWSSRRDPLDHCALNVALYGETGARWAMTERRRNAITRGSHIFHLGPSTMRWRGETLEIDIDEIGAPIPKRIRGTVRITPSAFPARSFALDTDGLHIWQPIAPSARIAVELSRPGLAWHGTGYLDSNFGAEPLEQGFREWTWSRAHLGRDAVVLYDATRRDGTPTSLALRFDPEGNSRAIAAPSPIRLPRTRWRVARSSRADAGARIAVRRTLEDTPFYSRSLIRTQIDGEVADAFHESLSLDRFRSSVVRAMLPFRMPRRFF